MASGISDQKLIKSLSIFIVLGVVLTLFLILLGNLNAGTINERQRDGRNAMAETPNERYASARRSNQCGRRER